MKIVKILLAVLFTLVISACGNKNEVETVIEGHSEDDTIKITNNKDSVDVEKDIELGGNDGFVEFKVKSIGKPELKFELFDPSGEKIPDISVRHRGNSRTVYIVQKPDEILEDDESKRIIEDGKYRLRIKGKAGKIEVSSEQSNLTDKDKSNIERYVEVRKQIEKKNKKVDKMSYVSDRDKIDTINKEISELKNEERDLIGRLSKWM